MDNTTPAPNTVIADCARMREEKAQQPYTIPKAIQDAEYLRRTPDAPLDPVHARRVVDTLLSALERSTCYLKAMKNGEETFVLMEHDKASPEAIVAWADLAEAHGCDPEKVAQAYALAGRWQNHPKIETTWPS